MNEKERWTDLEALIDKGIIKQTKSVLDIGIHIGYITKLLYEKLSKFNEIEYFGIEKQEVLLNQAFKYLPKEINLCTADALVYNFIRTFDTIFCLGVLHKYDGWKQKKLLENILAANANQVILRTGPKEGSLIILYGCMANYSIQVFKGNQGQGYLYILNKISDQWPPN